MGIEQGSIGRDQEQSMFVNEQAEHDITHNCGIIGVFANSDTVDVVAIAQVGLYGLQPRGHEGAGMAVTDGYEFVSHKGDGWVKNVFTPEAVGGLKSIRPTIAIGQSRYSTQGTLGHHALQPFAQGELFFAHNGTLANGSQVAKHAQVLGYHGDMYSDSWALYQTLLRGPGQTIEEKIGSALSKTEPAYSLILSDGKKMFGIRDRLGVRPLVLGRLSEERGYVLASEPNAFGQVGAYYERDIRPGEGVAIDQNGVRTFFEDPRRNIDKSEAFCAFEYVYIASPDSKINGRWVGEIRYDLGRRIARRDLEAGFAPDVIVPVQNSGSAYADGYAEEMKMQGRKGLVANSYTGRVFIEPGGRDVASRIKQRVNPPVVSGKEVVVIDDSIVRSTTARQLREVLMDHPKYFGMEAPRSIHIRSGSPKIIDQCFLGVDMAKRREELIAYANPTDEAIAQELGFDSVRYAEVVDLVAAIRGNDFVNAPSDRLFQENGLCGGCFTGFHPVRTDQTLGKFE